MIIISGAQIGVDRAALDAAIEVGAIDPNFMGWCPRGRRAKDGVIPSCYRMREHQSSAYQPRTLANVQAADATLVLCWGSPSGGTALTIRYCRESGNPWTAIDLKNRSPQAEKNVARLLRDRCVQVLNVAGPGKPEIYQEAFRFVKVLLQEVHDG